MTSDLQGLEETSKGGPNTDEGKAVSRMNALTHGVLRNALTPYEEGMELEMLEKLREEYTPSNTLERILFERIAIHYVKLHRVSKAEREFMLSVLDPRIVKDRFELNLKVETVINEGYTPKVDMEAVERLLTVYARYETNLENRLFRAMRELRENRAIISSP